MDDKKDRSGLIQNHITKLSQYYDNAINSDELDEVIYGLAIEYAGDNPGEYFVVLPGIILPLSS